MPIELTLRDGTPAIMWPLLPTDGQALRFGYDHLSARSRRQRFLGPVDRLDDRMLRRLVDGVDGEHHIALVLVALPFDGPEQPVGVARLVQYADDESTAEMAFTVADDWHGRGVASALAAVLLRLRPAAVHRLRAEVAADNRASIALLANLGTSHVSFVHPGVLEITVDLDTSEAPAVVGG
jgi:acetyltransferase